ncbi:Protein of unknown function (DUF3099) [Frankia torreyi]|uniref:DUF3099 family protein n=1 Tax=Frankia torreyi TaxID=1856 RepID=A0A0D8BHK9_9ACTN|nr:MULTISPECIES: DUF3099 domain-containing protein [Frankia]KJE23555.1 Protein of unknown function (DUF3099) [Frankia torreyi]KQM05860.1 Protein of unknown function (DUF3099) [Frankia sp. CpI1-P]
MMFKRRETVLITSAGRSRQSDIHRRERRYLASMLFRVICFVLAVVAFQGWLRFIAVAIAVILPWVAVVVANGGPPPERDRPATFDPVRAVQDAPAALTADPHRVVDSEGWVDDAGWVHGRPSAAPGGAWSATADAASEYPADASTPGSSSSGSSSSGSSTPGNEPPGPAEASARADPVADAPSR